MPTQYRLVLTDDRGSRLANPFNPIDRGFRAMRKANTIAPFFVELPYTFESSLFKAAYPRELMLQVWRKPQGGTMSLFNNYIITRYERHSNPPPHGMIILRGYDMNILLFRRIVAAKAGSANARITDQADDMMKGLVTDAQSDVIAPTPDAGTRAWANLTVAADTSDGPSLTMDLEYQKLLTFSGGGAFKKIVNASREAGTDLFFEVQPYTVLENSIDFIFNTFTTQIGQDLTDKVKFSIGNSTIIGAVQVYDYSKSENYIYAGGKGKDADRAIVQAYDSEEYLRSIWARSEGFADKPSVDDSSLQNEADAMLYDKRRVIQVQGDIAQTKQLIFGRDYNFGDLVTARVFEDSYDAMIKGVTVGMQSGEDIVEIEVDYRL